jgi:hypothetical protein
MIERYLEDFAVGRPTARAEYASMQSASRLLPPSSIPSPSNSTTRSRAIQFFVGWRRAAGIPPRSRCGSWSRAI